MNGWLEVDFKRPISFNTLVLVEPVNPSGDYPAGRIKSYRFDRWDGAAWVEVGQGRIAPPSPDPIPSPPLPRDGFA